MFLSSQIYIFSHLYPVIMKVLSTTYQFPEIIPEWMAATQYSKNLSYMYYYIQSHTKIKISDLLSLFILEQFRPIYICSQNFFFHLCLSYKCAMGPNNSPFEKRNIIYIVDFFDIRPCFGDVHHQELNINRYIKCIFSSNQIVYVISFILCFWASDPLINKFY